MESHASGGPPSTRRLALVVGQASGRGTIGPDCLGPGRPDLASDAVGAFPYDAIGYPLTSALLVVARTTRSMGSTVCVTRVDGVAS